MSLKTNDTKRECMDSLFVKCLNRNGWCKVISKNHLITENSSKPQLNSIKLTSFPKS